MIGCRSKQPPAIVLRTLRSRQPFARHTVGRRLRREIGVNIARPAPQNSRPPESSTNERAAGIFRAARCRLWPAGRRRSSGRTSPASDVGRTSGRRDGPPRPAPGCRSSAAGRSSRDLRETCERLPTSGRRLPIIGRRQVVADRRETGRRLPIVARPAPGRSSAAADRRRLPAGRPRAAETGRRLPASGRSSAADRQPGRRLPAGRPPNRWGCEGCTAQYGCTGGVYCR